MQVLDFRQFLGRGRRALRQAVEPVAARVIAHLEHRCLKLLACDPFALAQPFLRRVAFRILLHQVADIFIIDQNFPENFVVDRRVGRIA
ncbi:hypothetical protein Y025_5579 [Burkholderia pseudomallei TSV32]|nr:hypothetical protein Y025_5579 [Burkholderia pseudomallei TSV32]